MVVVVISVAVNALSVWRVWFDPGCADCVLEAGWPLSFLSHGGFFTETLIQWRGLVGDIVLICGLAVLCGFVLQRRGRS
jgi:hypothetical protein